MIVEIQSQQIKIFMELQAQDVSSNGRQPTNHSQQPSNIGLMNNQPVQQQYQGQPGPQGGFRAGPQGNQMGMFPNQGQYYPQQGGPNQFQQGFALQPGQPGQPQYQMQQQQRQQMMNNNQQFQMGNNQIVNQEIAMLNKQQGFPQQQQMQQQQQVRDYEIPPAGYKPPRYPREVIPEVNDENQTLTDGYQRFLYTVGDCCGTGKTYAPCCFCVDMPYVQVEQGFVAINERFGKYVRTEGPGLKYFNPCTDKMYPIDCKVIVIDCPRQFVMTKDNIMASIDATVYFRIIVPRKAFYFVNDIHVAVQQITLATMKNLAGGRKFQELVEKREELKREIEEFVDKHVWEWVNLYISFQWLQ